MQGSKKYLIYMHTAPNGKKYVGLTCQKPYVRWKNGLGYFNYNKTLEKQFNIHFINAIKKYGWNNFEHTILEDNIDTLELANEREKYWIAYYDSFRNGYNATTGGDGCHHHKLSEEAKRKIGEANKGHIPWNKGIPCSEELKKHLSEINKGKPSYVRTEEHKEKMKQIHLNSGYVPSEETRKKISEHNRGKIGYWKGKKRSEETNKKISETLKKKPIRYWLGKKRSPESVEKMKKHLKEYYERKKQFDEGKQFDK